MAFPKFTNVPTAVATKSNIDLSCQHVTTSDFMQLGVAKLIEVVPDQSFSIDHQCFMRMDPMPVPTFGRANVQHRAFWVPFRTLFPAWNDFITDTPHYYSSTNVTDIVRSVPTISNKDLCVMLCDPAHEYSTEESGDFIYTDYNIPEDETVPVGVQERQVKLTSLGRWTYKILRSLGITLTWSSLNDDKFSVLPILALMRVYYDYYYPCQYINDSDSAYILQFLTRDITTTDYYITIEALRKIFKILYNVPYASDYFTSAWDNPVAPNVSSSSRIVINDITNDNGLSTSSSSIVNDSSNRTPLLGTLNNAGGVLDSVKYISQYALNALQSLSDYMRRHQIAGSRALDRYLARWGVKLPDEVLNRSVMLDEWQQDLQFGDVTSTADTDGAGLGYYAGKGLSLGEGFTNFEAQKEYGYIIILSVIQPAVQYYQGLHRMTQHISKLDFFTPEFDNLGTQAIGAKELYCPESGIGYINCRDYQNRVFGFTPRYAEYKVPYSQITGDISLPRFVTNSAWTLYRDITPFLFDTPNQNFDGEVEHSLKFIMATDNLQYNRIFYNTDDTADHFNIIHTFKIKSSFPGKPLWDDYEFEHEDKARKVTMKVNGSTVE